jgi:hypothetical protein
MTEENCKGFLKMDSWPYGRSSIKCSRKVWKDGYCKTHHPDEKRRRQKGRDNKKETLYQQSINRLNR